MSKHLDDMVREFREYAEGKNGYDELDFKADLLAWHREEAERELLRWARFFEDSSMNAMTPSERLYKRAAELRASLEVEDE